MVDKQQLERLRYKYNTLKIISIGMVYIIALSFAACFIMYDTKAIVKEHNEWLHKQLMQCIKTP